MLTCKWELKISHPGRQVSSLTEDTSAIVQIYLPTTVRGSMLDQADTENDTQEPSLLYFSLYPFLLLLQTTLSHNNLLFPLKETFQVLTAFSFLLAVTVAQKNIPVVRFFLILNLSEPTAVAGHQGACNVSLRTVWKCIINSSTETF